MSVQQISVFLESRPGHLRRVLDAFEDAHVSVRGYSASDTGDYGIVRFIVDAPDKALAVLQDMGAAATQTDVLCATTCLASWRASWASWPTAAST